MDKKELVALKVEICQAGGTGAVALFDGFPDCLAEYWRLLNEGCKRALWKGRPASPQQIFKTRKPQIRPITPDEGSLRMVVGQELKQAILYFDGHDKREYCLSVNAGGDAHWQPISGPDLAVLLNGSPTLFLSRNTQPVKSEARLTVVSVRELLNEPVEPEITPLTKC